MGKSPGKWIKGIIFGKKTSKSNFSKGRGLSRSASEKPARVSSKEPVSTSIDDTPLISDPFPGTVLDRIDNSSFDKGDPTILESDELVSSSSKKDGDKPLDTEISNESEKIRLEQAATVVQASFRSYQARRAFQTLKGIITLQAAVRGCLVRRQAVATLFCMQGIVKCQAITRGYIVRQSRNGNGQCRKQSLVAKDANNQDSCEPKCKPADTLLKNAFVYSLLSSSPSAMPLCIQYGSGEPNSASCWLLRWSISQVWAPNSKQKETGDLQLQQVETEQIKPKCKGRKPLSVTVQNDPNHADSETVKLKHKGRKSSSPSVKSAQGNLQFDEGKIKPGLKKIQKPSGEISKEADINVGKPKRYSKKQSRSPAPKFYEGTSNTPIDTPMKDLAEAAEHNDMESSLELSGSNSPANQLTPESMTKVPSYMAKTASSKAKVKVQVSPRFGQDAVDKNVLTRRHSLPSSINGKLMSSPRVHGLVQANGREGINTDRYLSSSRDVTDKGIQVDWRR